MKKLTKKQQQVVIRMANLSALSISEYVDMESRKEYGIQYQAMMSTFQTLFPETISWNIGENLHGDSIIYNVCQDEIIGFVHDDKYYTYDKYMMLDL